MAIRYILRILDGKMAAMCYLKIENSKDIYNQNLIINNVTRDLKETLFK